MCSRAYTHTHIHTQTNATQTYKMLILHANVVILSVHWSVYIVLKILFRKRHQMLKQLQTYITGEKLVLIVIAISNL